MTASFAAVDLVVVLAYFACHASICCYYARRASIAGKEQTSASYFLASKHASWWAVGASFFASNIGSDTLGA